MSPEIGLAKGACTLWEEDLLLDYTIEVEDEQFRVHKVVMASVSDYFKAMLTGGMVESREDKVRLEGLTSLAVKNVIEFIYTGEFGSSKASAEEQLTCAVYLQIPAAVKICAASLCEEVNMENCFHILSIFKSYGIKDGIEYTVNFMKHNIEDILDACKPEDMTHDEFLSLMNCWQKSEWQLFVLAVKWLKVDSEQRKAHTNTIMSHIRFCLMSPTELALIESMEEMGIFSEANGPWYDLVEKAQTYHNLPIHQKVLDDSVQGKIRTEPSPVCFGMHSSLQGKLFAVHQGKSWKQYDTVNPLVLLDNLGIPLLFNCIEINNFYIVYFNSGELVVQCSIFDPRTLTWSSMAPMGIPRDDYALVYHEKYLYALGGYDRRVEDTRVATDVIEKYDFCTNTWSVSTDKMPVALFDFSAFSVGGCIYIPGGLITGGHYSNRVYCFDPEVSQWSEKAPYLPVTAGNMVTVDIHREKVIAYIDQHLILHYYKPSVDQWLVYDRNVASRLKANECDLGGNLIATGNTIYFVDCHWDGESDNKKELPSVTEKWTFGENGLMIDSKVLPLTDDTDSGWTYNHFSHICVLLAVIPPSVRK